MENFKEKFEKILIEKFGITQEDIQTEVNFINDLKADSLDMVELTMEFEKTFLITIPDEDAEKIITVGDAQRYLTERLSDERSLNC